MRHPEGDDLDEHTFLTRFAPQLRHGNASVMCGAGVSVPSHLPDWKELLEDARKELGLDEDFENLSLMATYYVSTVDGGRSRLTKMIKNRLMEGRYEANAVHRALWGLPVPYLWSLNFDNLLEAAYEEMTGRAPRVIQSDEQMIGTLARGSDRALVKIHGGIDQLDEADGRSLVITRDDFDDYLKNFPRTWSRLLADFHTKSLLFVGISFADPNMQTMLRLVRQADNTVTQQHYAVVKTPGLEASAESRALHKLQLADLRCGGVEPVELDSYESLPALLGRAAVLARPPVVMVSGSLGLPGLHETFLAALGTMLASAPQRLSLVHGGSESIRTLPTRFAEHLQRIGRYQDHEIIQVRRSEPSRATTVTERRLGTIVFPGTDRAAVRRDLCSRAAVCIMIGGQYHTREEVEECHRQGIRVVPVPLSSASPSEPTELSQTLWETIASKNDKDPLDAAIASFDLEDPVVKADRVVAAVVAHLYPEVAG